MIPVNHHDGFRALERGSVRVKRTLLEHDYPQQAHVRRRGLVDMIDRRFRKRARSTIPPDRHDRSKREAHD